MTDDALHHPPSESEPAVRLQNEDIGDIGHSGAVGDNSRASNDAFRAVESERDRRPCPRLQNSLMATIGCPVRAANPCRNRVHIKPVARGIEFVVSSSPDHRLVLQDSQASRAIGMLPAMNDDTRVPPTVGIVGAGQLARMTIQAAIPLAVPIALLADRADDGAAIVSPNVEIGSPRDAAAMDAFAARCDVLTFDHELVPFEHLDRLEAAGRTLYPSAATMALAQNKRLQRERFCAAGLPVPPFQMLSGVEDLREFGRSHGWPVVLKAARGGYDGRGVWIANDESAGAALATELSALGVELLAEQWVPIEREVAIIIARRPGGETAVYPLVETIQVDGMCREIIAPAPVSDEIFSEARAIAGEVARIADVAGILAVELFVAGGRLIVNEIATRPHNSGHYTIEGCETSQFEQHLRAILDWPLGSTGLTAPFVVTVNVVGGPDGSDPVMRLPEVLSIPGVHVHLYGKVARPGRKLGHVTVRGDDVIDVRARANQAAAVLSGSVYAGVEA